MSKPSEIIVALDVGTSKVAVLVGEIKPDQSVEVIGVGQASSTGLKEGVVVDIGATVDSIREAIHEAEEMADVDIKSVYVGISGKHIRGINSHGVVAIKNREITQEDVSRVKEQAGAIAIPPETQVLHSIVQEYAIDNQGGVRRPEGMEGIRLEGKVHVVTAAATAVRNLVRCCEKAGLVVADVILEPLASAESVLVDEERKLGVALVDIGAGTSDILIFHNQALVHCCAVPYGGHLITNDIAMSLHTTYSAAERIKIDKGAASPILVDPDEQVEVPAIGTGDPQLTPRGGLCDIIQARMEEILMDVRRELSDTGYFDRLGAGIVLTGGTVMLEGTADLANELMDLPVRIGTPVGVTGLSDMVKSSRHATAVGLLISAARRDPIPVEPKRGFFGRMAQAIGAALHEL